jgi:hypothetical protein
VSTEERAPQAWYALVYASQAASLQSYLDHYRAMEDPKLEAIPSEGAVYAKLSSSLFAGMDHTDVAREAKRLVEIITGVAKIRQAPGNLTLHSVVAVYADGESKKFPLLSIYLSVGRHMDRFKDETKVVETFEKSVVLFALKYGDAYPLVNEVLRSFAQSDDWSGLYRVHETIRLDLNKNGTKKQRNARNTIVQLGWASESEINSFDTTVDSYRHRRAQPMPRTMQLDVAQNLTGRIIEKWMRAIAQRPVPSRR